MPAPTQLSLYKGACLVLKQAPIEALDEEVALVQALDVAWARDAIKKCLQRGLWNFATRTREFYSDPSIEPTYGPRFAYPFPDDYVTLVAISADEYLRQPLLNQRSEASYWWCDIEPIYVSYVSDDDEFGRDYSKWPKNFETYVEHALAEEVAPMVSGVDAVEIVGKARMALRAARATDAREEATVEPQRGTWSRSRTAGRQLDRSRSRF